jgi:hypothetical protein
MAMKRRNIAVLMTAADSESQANELRGIEEYAKSHECNIAVFLWFTGAFETKKHNLGEANIVNLPDLNLFDGVILLANQWGDDYWYDIAAVSFTCQRDGKYLLTCPIIRAGFHDSLTDGHEGRFVRSGS